eukprot:gnl/TRDRNA2_/TRDRNA2_209965_c0_seq1.p1 gnl/TRDRNA2_/TRDRNA2_209965_c0~~gnl/TRDRNA2_/TRDRNA2_209965_c0_seq1.p1  ORF type:complete len:123 (-),score=15.68 gnl/TRDRNA2_/TRDRNA2_209965_c0_seq1:35-403(-)
MKDQEPVNRGPMRCALCNECEALDQVDVCPESLNMVCAGCSAASMSHRGGKAWSGSTSRCPNCKHGKFRPLRVVTSIVRQRIVTNFDSGSTEMRYAWPKEEKESELQSLLYEKKFLPCYEMR